MDKQEAKLILSSYTLGNEPKDDERFDEAKMLVENDPELRDWWHRQTEDDKAISSSLRSFKVPDDLHSALRETVVDQRRKRLRFAKLRSWISIAAALALCSYLYFVYGIDRSDEYVGPLDDRAFSYSFDGPRLTYFDRDTKKLRDWLVESGIDLPTQLPPKLLDLEGVGCRPLNWSEERVALMCFNAETVYHLFIGQEKDFPEFTASSNIGYEERPKGWTLSRWKDGDFLFVLTAKATQSEMSRFLASYSPAAANDA